MLRALVVLAAAGCSLRVSSQPAACESDRQCQSGFYCVPDVFLCRQCLDCEDLKRDAPRAPTACIKSVAECGSCIKGLVDDLRGDVTAECVAEAGSGAAGAGLPAWAWAAVTLGLLLFALVVVAVLYVLRNTNTFKILASTRTSVRSPGVVASAPDAPPPYRAHYHQHHHHDDHRDHNHDRDTDHYDTDNDAGPDRDRRDLLFDEEHPSAPRDVLNAGSLPGASPPGSHRAAGKHHPPSFGTREMAARQATRFFSEPYYVRPPRYSDAGLSSPAPAGPPAPVTPAPPSLHDEDTMESTWTPSASDDNGNVAAASGELAQLLAAARLHRPCTQDSKNNRGSGSATAGAAPRGPPPPAPPAPAAPVSYIINVVQNMQNRT